MSYTRDQIYAAIRKADQAGDAGAVRALSTELKGMDAPEATPEKPKSFWRGVVEGVEKPLHNLAVFGNDAAQVAAKVFPGAALVEPFLPAERQGVDALHKKAQAAFARSPVQGSGAGRLVGNVIGSLPAALTPGGIVAESAMAGASLADNPDDPMDVAANAAEGAVAGKVMKTAAPFVKKALSPLSKFLGVSAEKAVQQAAGREAVDAGNKEGVRVLTSDVRPPKTFIGKTAQSLGEKIPFAGTGGQRAAQQAERVAAIKNVLQDHGGEAISDLFDTSPTAINDVAGSLNTQRAADIKRYTGIKNAVIDKFGGAVPVPKAVQAIDEQIAKLQTLKVQDVRPVIAKLANWRDALAGKTNQIDTGVLDAAGNSIVREVPDVRSLRTIEDLRKIMGEAFNDPGLAGVKSVGQKAVNSVYGPLRDDMADYIKANGGPLAHSAWANANAKLSAMAGELDSAAFKSVLRNSEITPENVGRLLFSKSRSDVARLYGNLDVAGKARAQAAILQRAYDKSISAEGGLSPERFANNIKSLGDSVGVLFRGDDLARVQGLTKLLDTTRRASAAQAMPQTGAQNMPLIAGWGLGNLFGQMALPVATIGGFLARAYESAPVRNALIRYGKAEAGSVAEKQADHSLAKLLSATAANQGLLHAANENVPAIAAASGYRDEQQKPQ